MHGEVPTVQHQTKVFYFVTLKFAGSPDHHILIDYALMKSLVISIKTIELPREHDVCEGYIVIVNKSIYQHQY